MNKNNEEFQERNKLDVKTNIIIVSCLSFPLNNTDIVNFPTLKTDLWQCNYNYEKPMRKQKYLNTRNAV